MANPERALPLEVRKLAPADDRSRFRSGNADLDRFFARYAGQNQFRHHIGTTYVAVDAAGEIAGYVTVSASELSPGSVSAASRKRPRYPVPILRLARLAVAENAQGKGAGRLLVRATLVLAQRMAEEVGCIGVVVDAKPEAVAFYAKLGFMPLELVGGELGDRPLRQTLFLELAQVPAAT